MPLCGVVHGGKYVAVELGKGKYSKFVQDLHSRAEAHSHASATLWCDGEKPSCKSMIGLRRTGLPYFKYLLADNCKDTIPEDTANLDCTCLVQPAGVLIKRKKYCSLLLSVRRIRVVERELDFLPDLREDPTHQEEQVAGEDSEDEIMLLDK